MGLTRLFIQMWAMNRSRSDFDPTVDTMAIQFHENDVRDTSVHPVSEDVYEIRLGDQVAAHVKSTVPFDT